MWPTTRWLLSQPFFLSLALALILLAPLASDGRRGRVWAVSQPLARLACPAGYQASIYAQGLRSPDGLAFDPAGTLYVAEELAGRVSSVAPDGSATPIVSGLDHPEGIAFDPDGNLYIVEDRQHGRVLRVSPSGTLSVLMTDREAPEGIAYATNGTIYITESNIQFTDAPFDYRTRITAITSAGKAITVRSDVIFWSYSGITIGADGMLYVANEAAETNSYGVSGHDSIFKVDPASGKRTLAASNLFAPEGLRFGAGNTFPLYVIEENLGNGAGRLSRVEANGDHTPFCTGFLSIEDVIIDQSGRIYVSEDGSGSIIQIEPIAPAPTPQPTPQPTPTAGPQPALFLPVILGGGTN